MNSQISRRTAIGLAPLLVLFCTLLVGCAAYQRIDEAPNVAEETFRIAVEERAAHRDGQSRITPVSEPWVQGRMIDSTPPTSERIPRNRDCRVRLVVDAPMSLTDFAHIVTSDCHLPVRITQDAWAALAGGDNQRQDASFSGSVVHAPMVPALGQSSLNSGNPASRSFAWATGGKQEIQPIRWLGKPLSGLLDVVTSQLGLSWSYRNDGVVIHYLDTRTFRVALSSELDVVTNVSSGASLSSGSGGGTSGDSANSLSNESAQQTLVSIKSRFSDDVRAAVEAMLTPRVGTMALSPSIGTLTVTDTPHVLDQVEQYIADVNARMTRQAMLHVTVASVTLSDADSLGINWNLVWNSVTGNYGAGIVNSFSPLQGASAAGFGILDAATGRAGQFAGTEAILSALSKQGAVSIMRERGVTTQHLQPTPIHITKEEQYVCGRSQTNTADVGATESIQMCSVVTGFAMDILPDIHGSRDLTLQFSLNMSPPATITQVPGNLDKPVFAASVDRQVFLQRVGLKSGQTLVISDFQEASETSRKEGMGTVSNWFPAGGGAREKQRSVIVVIISPRVLPQLEEEV